MFSSIQKARFWADKNPKLYHVIVIGGQVFLKYNTCFENKNMFLRKRLEQSLFLEKLLHAAL